jgi:hypothetical protein
VYSRAYALKLLASSMKSWTALGPDGGALFSGGRTVADLVELLLEPEAGSKGKSKKETKQPSTPKSVKKRPAASDAVAAGSGSIGKKGSKAEVEGATVATPKSAAAKTKRASSAKKTRVA